MKQALGLVEVQGLSTAVVVADTMVKAANVTILEIENSKGQGYMTVKIAGDVGAVNAAVSAGKQTGLENQKLVSFKVIARPADSVDQIFGAAKNTKTDALIQPYDSAEVQTQAEKIPVKEDIKETLKPEVQLDEKLEENPPLVEQTAEEKAAQERQAEPQTEPQTEPQAEPEKISSVNPSGAKKTVGNKNKK